MTVTTDFQTSSRDRYDAVLQTVARNTSPKQPPGARTATVTRILSPQFAPASVRKSLRAAVEQGDLFAHQDANGVNRYTVAVEFDLRRLYRETAEREHPDQELVGRIYRAIEVVADAE